MSGADVKLAEMKVANSFDIHFLATDGTTVSLEKMLCAIKYLFSSGLLGEGRPGRVRLIDAAKLSTGPVRIALGPGLDQST
jgi:hypothetical protein